MRCRRRLGDRRRPPSADAGHLEANHYFFEEILAFGPQALTQQLLRRRYDLGHTNIDRLATRDAESDPAVRAEIDATIAAARAAAITLDRLIATAAAAF